MELVQFGLKNWKYFTLSEVKTSNTPNRDDCPKAMVTVAPYWAEILFGRIRTPESGVPESQMVDPHARLGFELTQPAVIMLKRKQNSQKAGKKRKFEAKNEKILKKEKLEQQSRVKTEEEQRQHCGNFLSKKTTVLHKGVIELKRLRDLNMETYTEGPLIKSIQFHPGSTVGLVAGVSGVASLFQVDGYNNTKLQSVQFERFPIHCARFTNDGCQFLVGSQHHRHFFCYDMMADKSLRIINSPAAEITHMKVYTWDMSARACVHRFLDDGCIVGSSLAFSPNSQFLACGSLSGIVNVYDARNLTTSNAPSPLKILLNLTTPVTSLKFNAASEILAMASNDKDNAIKLVHFPSMTVFNNFPSAQTPLFRPQCLDFSLNSGYFTLGNGKGAALLFRWHRTIHLPLVQ
uniref:U3 small nucleolar RNA-associated protein 18-like protein n=1 Tax=Timema cristinae TaxID=61476 RepID=A0A7R9H185_TIMCR|nr:unnamed protein product [Timema cristinae]